MLLKGLLAAPNTFQNYLQHLNQYFNRLKQSLVHVMSCQAMFDRNNTNKKIKMFNLKKTISTGFFFIFGTMVDTIFLLINQRFFNLKHASIVQENPIFPIWFLQMTGHDVGGCGERWQIKYIGQIHHPMLADICKYIILCWLIYASISYYVG